MLRLLRIDPLPASAVVRIRRPIFFLVRPDVHPSLLESLVNTMKIMRKSAQFVKRNRAHFFRYAVSDCLDWLLGSDVFGIRKG
jgi:hypothetical protein